jgi:hypothetical protein
LKKNGKNASLWSKAAARNIPENRAIRQEVQTNI